MLPNPDFKRFAAFLGLNFCLSLVICSFFLLFAGSHPLGLAYAGAALVSNTALLALAVALPALLLYATGLPVLPGALLAVFQLWLVTDLAVYKIFKFHMNSMVLNLVLTPGGLESLDQGWGTKALFVLVAAGAGAAQWWFWRLAAGARAWRALSGRRPLALAGLLLLAVAADKGLYAWANLYDAVLITRNSQLFPLYQPLRVRSFASKYLGVKLDQEVRGGIDSRYSGLDYPKAPLLAEPPARPLNFLFIVVDSLRADMLDPEIMPETWALGKKATVFRNHYSGGNCTRFGVFSMLYGLYGNYWFPMLGERRGPVLLDELKRQGYDLRVYASAKLSFPEFNKTCFVSVPREGIYDEPAGANGAEKDRDISERFISYLRSRDAKKPYFSFIFYDASHGNYDPQPGLEKFSPAFGVSQLALNKDNVGGLFNRYKNSILGDDLLVGRILKELAARGGLKDTVVLVLGDHGEAFLERGRYGHNQGYSPEEVRVPLVLYLPGRAPAVLKHPTSHLDIVPTLLPLAGVKNPATDYASGRSLFESGGRPYLASASWDSAGLITPEGILEMPLEAYKGGLKVFDPEYRALPGKEAEKFSPLIMQFQREARRFSR
ncbi:MAG: sulfatase-like hydrolase/transferase [Elusimicrobiales bacterium]|nr:sulfatase-like hydrolase/transferase [Elusimicrobiales bacterium]